MRTRRIARARRQSGPPSGSCTESRAIATTISPLTAMIRNTISATSGRFRRTNPGSTSMPTETKNKPAKRSRNGRASATTRCDRSDSPMIRPAMKAPSAREMPNAAARRAVPRASPTTPRRKISRLRVRDRASKTGGRSRRPRGRTIARKTNALPIARISSSPIPPVVARLVRMTTNRIVPRSWTVDQARATCACSVSVSPRSPRTLPSTVLELLERTAPRKTDSS